MCVCLPGGVNRGVDGIGWGNKYMNASYFWLWVPHLLCINFDIYAIQDSFLADDFKSQMDGMLSQDSTYQGDRHFYASQLSQGPFN